MTQKHEGMIQQNSQSSIELERGQRGAYGWKIKLYFTNPGDWIAVINQIKEIDEALQRRYLSGGNKEEA